MQNRTFDWDATSGDAEIENKPTIPTSFAPTNAEPTSSLIGIPQAPQMTHLLEISPLYRQVTLPQTLSKMFWLTGILMVILGY